MFDPPADHEEYRHELDVLARIRAQHAASIVLLPMGQHRARMLELLHELISELHGDDWSSNPDPQGDEAPLTPADVIHVTDLLRSIADNDREARPAALNVTRSFNRYYAAAERGAPQQSQALLTLWEKHLEALAKIPESRDEAIDGPRGLRASIATRRARHDLVVARLQQQVDEENAARERAHADAVERARARRAAASADGAPLRARAIRPPAPATLPVAVDRNFAISLRDLVLTEALLDRGGEGDADEALALIDETLEWRTRYYGARHPFTLVAVSHRIRAILRQTEATSAWPSISAEDRSRLIELQPELDDFIATRIDVLGERHSAMVSAYTLKARLLIQLGDRAGTVHAARAALAVEGKQSGTFNHIAMVQVVLAAVLAASPAHVDEAEGLLQLAEKRIIHTPVLAPWAPRAQLARRVADATRLRG